MNNTKQQLKIKYENAQQVTLVATKALDDAREALDDAREDHNTKFYQSLKAYEEYEAASDD